MHWWEVKAASENGLSLAERLRAEHMMRRKVKELLRISSEKVRLKHHQKHIAPKDAYRETARKMLEELDLISHEEYVSQLIGLVPSRGKPEKRHRRRFRRSRGCDDPSSAHSI